MDKYILTIYYFDGSKSEFDREIDNYEVAYEEIKNQITTHKWVEILSIEETPLVVNTSSIKYWTLEKKEQE